MEGKKKRKKGGCIWLPRQQEVKSGFPSSVAEMRPIVVRGGGCQIGRLVNDRAFELSHIYCWRMPPFSWHARIPTGGGLSRGTVAQQTSTLMSTYVHICKLGLSLRCMMVYTGHRDVSASTINIRPKPFPSLYPCISYVKAEDSTWVANYITRGKCTYWLHDHRLGNSPAFSMYLSSYYRYGTWLTSRFWWLEWSSSTYLAVDYRYILY